MELRARYDLNNAEVKVCEVNIILFAENVKGFSPIYLFIYKINNIIK